jgi:hypothetical protein
LWQDSTRLLGELFTLLAPHLTKTEPLIIFMDDPLIFGNVSPRDVFNIVDAIDHRVLFVTAVRIVDWETYEAADICGSFSLITHTPITIPDVFDDDEWKRFPEYLTLLGIAPDHDDAARKTNELHRRLDKTPVILSSLYYLIPDTKATIQGSIKDEYFRLDSKSWLRKVVLGATQYDTTVLRDAYKRVVVADYYKAPLPIELLVSSLGISYEDWRESTGLSGPAWGIFYDEVWDSGDSICYRPRNALITNVIVEAVNGGFASHSGDVQLIEDLLRKCTGTTPVYREWALRVLVPHKNLQKVGISPQEGLRLYDAAIASLPLPMRAILHHKALWIRHTFNDFDLAHRVLLNALNTKPYPYSRHDESDGHIHTTIAANLLEATRRGVKDLSDTRGLIADHIDKARRGRAFADFHTLHVAARTVLGLIRQMGADSQVDRITLALGAVSELDRTLATVQDEPWSQESNVESHRMLQDVRDELLQEFQAPEDLRRRADEAWEKFQSQAGFALVARRLLKDAMVRGRGKDFLGVRRYLMETSKKVSDSNASLDAQVHEMFLLLHYYWQINAHGPKGKGAVIPWNELVDHGSECIGKGSSNPLVLYLFGIVNAHKGNWPIVLDIQQRLREAQLPRWVLWKPRDRLLNEQGETAVLQGRFRRMGPRATVFSSQLGIDFIASRFDDWPNDDEDAFFEVECALGGYFARRRFV